MNRIDVVIRSLGQAELSLIKDVFSNENYWHDSRYEQQVNGEAEYLFAWLDGSPIGHLLLLWNGTSDEPVASDLKNCPHIQNLCVLEKHRRKGVGTTLMECAETLAKERGFTRIGLSVGTENLTAKKLYERLGYVEQTSFGIIIASWIVVNEDGQSEENSASIVYMVKAMS
ncbi:GNAT family N-acetyltransferase [Alicyclobacillus fodiniaquatilis]|uniref:GNAT family N-acetyltransferase n=1 Tax=Alicyclobacillus fodiniaquatilis TaxID=1661150 RepID=A0ABW4JMH9_9BACL